jgi:hypothetical protein
VIRYARELGVDRCVRQLDELTEQFGERFSPCKLMREMKGVR